jgi:hypothetical protein
VPLFNGLGRRVRPGSRSLALSFYAFAAGPACVQGCHTGKIPHKACDAPALAKRLLCHFLRQLLMKIYIAHVYLERRWVWWVRDQLIKRNANPYARLRGLSRVPCISNRPELVSNGAPVTTDGSKYPVAIVRLLETTFKPSIERPPDGGSDRMAKLNAVHAAQAHNIFLSSRH